MMRLDRHRWAGLIYWAAVLASLTATIDAVGTVIGDDRSHRGLELSKVSLDEPLRAGEPVSGRALIVNNTGATIWMESSRNTHFWLDWTVPVPQQIIPDTKSWFHPCGSESAGEVEVIGPTWWCFRQTSPTPDGNQLDRLRQSSDLRLWFAALITYRTGGGKIRHTRLCHVYNFQLGRFERSRRESCDQSD